MVSKSEYNIKGVLLAAGGLIILLLPKILTYSCYVIGGLIILTSVLMLLKAPDQGGASFMGIILGAIIILLPRVLAAVISFIAAGVLTIMAIIRLTKALSSTASHDQRLTNGIFSALLFVLAVIVFIKPFGAGWFTRVVIGVVMLLLAAYNFYIAHVIKQRYGDGGSSSSDILDLDESKFHDNN